MSKGISTAPALDFTADLQESLFRLSRKHSLSQKVGKRVEVILLGIQGYSNAEVVRRTSLARNTVKANRRRWSGAYLDLIEQEQNYQRGEISEFQFDAFVQSVLEDLPRSGTRKTFTMAQEQQIVALAAENPRDYNIPINEWTNSMLAKVAIAKNIVSTISTTQVWRVLKKSASPSP